MNLDHPLDRPVWNALRSRQSSLAMGDDKALRMLPDHGHFAAAADRSAQSNAALAALVPPGDQTWIFELDDVEPPAGPIVLDKGPAVQMVAHRVRQVPAQFAFVALTQADAAEMRALAHLARPGPFLART